MKASSENPWYRPSETQTFVQELGLDPPRDPPWSWPAVSNPFCLFTDWAELWSVFVRGVCSWRLYSTCFMFSSLSDISSVFKRVWGALSFSTVFTEVIKYFLHHIRENAAQWHPWSLSVDVWNVFKRLMMLSDLTLVVSCTSAPLTWIKGKTWRTTLTWQVDLSSWRLSGSNSSSWLGSNTALLGGVAPHRFRQNP